MNLNHLSDSALDQELYRLVKAEREILTTVLHHLKEADKRRLYAKFGYKSLFAYAVERFGYSEGEAYRRISAMQLLKEVPEIEEKIEAGTLSLTNITAAQTLFRQEKAEKRERTQDQKAAVLEKLEHCSKLEAVEILRIESGVTEVNDLKDYNFSAKPDLQEKLKRLFDLKALPESNLSELIDFMSDIALEKSDPLLKAERSEKRMEKLLEKSSEKRCTASPLEAKPCVNSMNTKTQSGRENSDVQPQKQNLKPRLNSSVKPISRYIPSTIRHAVYMRDRGICQNCGSTRAMQVEHIKPYAVGGEHSLENLRLLCRSCNQRTAI